mmetsp:Transcript_11730/g.36277  ORF Transcript_11730/g.36277 Transcript_11730/m.36277 type:complete len:238 (-) Transcript_11730:240-953(-)
MQSNTLWQPGSIKRLCHMPSTLSRCLSWAAACACRNSLASGSTEVSCGECSVRKGATSLSMSALAASVASRYSFASRTVVPTVRELKQRGSRSISSCRYGNRSFTAPAARRSVGAHAESAPTTGSSTRLAGCFLAASRLSMGATNTAPSHAFGRRCSARVATQPPIDVASTKSGNLRSAHQRLSGSASARKSSTRSSKRSTKPRVPCRAPSLAPKLCWSYARTASPSALSRCTSEPS